MTVLYRYESSSAAEGFLDEYGDWHNTGPGEVHLRCTEYPLLYSTKKGVWIQTGWEPFKKKFILTAAKKKFAHFTKEDSLESFRRRKIRQIVYLHANLHHAKEALELANAMVTP